eukprot:TRINITY_DN121856_c0_g1_i1.p1 TRINITY_DN121856_c0_g1~~TRINITY_DN121856_c0_g1_i1.p1  ORF type:complete len:319 (-),score=68.13 TRINITY_DN121856_c0_g1_i1:102-1058(-)
MVTRSMSFGVDDSIPLDTRLEKFHKTQAEILPLLEDPRKWDNECETVFTNFRRAVVHLRRDPEALDAVENKQVVWRFMCRLCKTRPFLVARCEEVLKILAMSDLWKKELLDDPESNIQDLPQTIKDKLDLPADDGKAPAAAGADGNVMTVVAQHFSAARVLTDSATEEWTDAGRGLQLAIAFGPGATEERVASVARALLKGKLLLGADAGSAGAESVVTACRKGEQVGLIVLPQTSLGARLDEDAGLVSYPSLCDEAQFTQLCDVFVQALRTAAEELVKADAPSEDVKLPVILALSSTPGEPQQRELTCSGFMHSFLF